MRAALFRLLPGLAVVAVVGALSSVPSEAAGPPKPFAVKAKATAHTVALKWQAGSKQSTKGFNIYRSTSRPIKHTHPINGRKLVTGHSFTDTGLVSGKSYWYAVQAIAPRGKKTATSGPVKITTTLIAPAAARLSTRSGDRSVTLSWKASTQGGVVSSWTLYRTSSRTARVVDLHNRVTTKHASTTSYVDGGRANGVTYRYAVVALNKRGSVTSNIATATAQPPAPRPAQLSAIPGDHRVDLAWTAGSGSAATSWLVYRSTTQAVVGSDNLLTTAAAAARTFGDTSALNGTTYYYALVAKNGGGSATSNLVTAKPLSTAPAAPSAPTLTATPAVGYVALAWTAGGGGGPVDSWSVFRSTSSPVALTGANRQPGFLDGDDTTYVDDDVVSGTKYYYVVVAANGGGTAVSPEVSSTPTTPPTSPATISAVGSLVAHTNQPAEAAETVAVAPHAIGNVLAVAVETKYIGTPAFEADAISGGGVTTWHRATAFPTLDDTHGQELWWGTVTTAGATTVTVSYGPGATAGTSESATSVDVQEFAASSGASTVWSLDVVDQVDTEVSTTTPYYPTLSAAGSHEVYVGYLAVPSWVSNGSTPGVVYQTDARGNQVVYATNVSGTLTPTATGPNQTFTSVGMLLKAQ